MMRRFGGAGFTRAPPCQFMITDPTSLHGKRALISGGTTGIGRAIAVDLVSQGCEVIVFGRDRKLLDDALLDMQKAGSTGDGLVADQSNLAEVRQVMKYVKEKWDSLDFLINNAGVGGGSLLGDDEETWDYLARTNLVGYVTCSRYAVEQMPAKGGHIVNIGSMTAEHLRSGSEMYTATKAGVRAFSEALRKGMEKRGIKVSLIEPGLTGSNLHHLPVEELEKQQHAERMLIAEDVAACVRFCLAQPVRANIGFIQIQPRLAGEE